MSKVPAPTNRIAAEDWSGAMGDRWLANLARFEGTVGPLHIDHATLALLDQYGGNGDRDACPCGHLQCDLRQHAGAQSVWVTLKQGRKNVILEIEDDGCGYDPKHVDKAGLGLANIHERVSNINGKLKITSKPGEGTKVVVTVPKDRPVTPTKRRQ